MKKILVYIISLITIFCLFPNSVFAFSCEEVSTMKKGFYVILEEEISTEKTKDSIPCFRVCSEKIEDNIEHRICEIKTQCEKPTGTKKDAKFTCQRIQVIKATSGAGLIYTYVGMIYKWAAGTIGIVAVFTLVYCGIGIMSSAGNSGAIDKYKERIMQSLLGLVVLFLSGLILYTINPNFFV